VSDVWAAVCLAPAPALWMAVTLHRGALQGVGAHAPVAVSLLGEGAVRILVAAVLLAAGAGVAGAAAATTLALLAVLGHLALRAGKALGPAAAPSPRGLRNLLGDTRAAVVGLALLAAIQQVDVLVAQHRLGAGAGPYIAAAVASKVVVWAAVGLALALLPEVSRQVRAGVDGRGHLARTVVLVLLIALPLAVVCAAAADPLLRLVFGSELAGAADALPWLAVAMALFACAFVVVQHALATAGRSPAGVLGVLALVAVAEPVALMLAGPAPADLAGTVAVLQLVLAAAAVAVVVRRVGVRTLAEGT
jgi:O-antigen/teichoic acid export membrane protein